VLGGDGGAPCLFGCGGVAGRGRRGGFLFSGGRMGGARAGEQTSEQKPPGLLLVWRIRTVCASPCVRVMNSYICAAGVYYIRTRDMSSVLGISDAQIMANCCSHDTCHMRIILLIYKVPSTPTCSIARYRAWQHVSSQCHRSYDNTHMPWCTANHSMLLALGTADTRVAVAKLATKCQLQTLSCPSARVNCADWAGAR